MRAKPSHHASRPRRGFTLVEILVTLGIIILLVSILIPVVSKARKVAGVTRVKRDLETIRVALDEYKNVWHIYPPVTPLPGPSNAPVFNTTTNNNINNIDGFPIVMDNGAHALYSALMLRGNVRVTRVTDPSSNLQIGGTAGYGPFLQHENWKAAPDPDFSSKYSQVSATTNLFLCDSNGRPILYVPASPLPLSYTKTSSIPTPPHRYVASSKTAGGKPTLYDFDAIPALVPDATNPSATVVPFHNMNYSSTPNGLAEFQTLMGDTDKDGIINTTLTPAESPAYNGPYILWTAGADGNYGINPSTKKSDDVANFDLPVSIREN